MYTKLSFWAGWPQWLREHWGESWMCDCEKCGEWQLQIKLILKAATEAACFGPDYAAAGMVEKQVLGWALSQLKWGNDLTHINFEVFLWL